MGLPPDAFWEQVPATYNAAMAGAAAARDEDFVLRRDLALMTAYFGGQLAGISDWRKMPDWPDFLARMTRPKVPTDNAALIARFEALVARGLATDET